MNDPGSIRVNTAKFKKILSLIRNGDFAHAGEEEAIELVFNEIPKNESCFILDVGCGLGGTANFVQSGQWGRVTGVDVVEEGISHAKQRYHDVEFSVDDILNPTTIKGRKFDLIYLFNVFYVLSDQTKSIKEITKLANQDSQLVIFDYVDCGNYDENRPEKAYDVLPAPIRLNSLEQTLKENGWIISSAINLTKKYREWYQAFVNNIASKKNEVIQFSDEAVYQFVYNTYGAILKNIEQGNLGGCVLYCKRG